MYLYLYFSATFGWVFLFVRSRILWLWSRPRPYPVLGTWQFCNLLFVHYLFTAKFIFWAVGPGLLLRQLHWLCAGSIPYLSHRFSISCFKALENDLCSPMWVGSAHLEDWWKLVIIWILTVYQDKRFSRNNVLYIDLFSEIYLPVNLALIPGFIVEMPESWYGHLFLFSIHPVCQQRPSPTSCKSHLTQSMSNWADRPAAPTHSFNHWVSRSVSLSFGWLPLSWQYCLVLAYVTMRFKSLKICIQIFTI